MRVGRDTKRRIEAIKADTYGPMQELVTALARLEEHSGTKRIARPLKVVIEKLEAWQRAVHG